MDVSERLTPEDLGRRDYLAASHVHRYALAARLCGGLRVVDLGCGMGYGSAMLAAAGATVTGVDVDLAVVREAAREHAEATFVADDALAYLRRTRADDVDAVVMLEALEHVREVEAVLEELARLAGVGVRLVVSVPNSRAFHEDNPYHLTDFGHAEARRAFARFNGVQWLYQYLAEGSLVLPEDGGDDFSGRVEALEQAEAEYANTFIAAVGFAPDALRTASARLHLVATPAHNRYMIELERANQEFFRMNRQLAREAYGKHDAAAAAATVWYEDRVREAETRAWILNEEKIAAERALAQYKAWHDAARYRAVDRAVEVVRRTPVVYPALKGARRAFRRVRPRRPSSGA